MTIIAYRDGVIACDSRMTYEGDASGAYALSSDKLFRKTVTENGVAIPVIIATSGESSSSLVYVDWYGSLKDKPQELFDMAASFLCLILRPDGLYEVDAYCRPAQVWLRGKNKFHAVGSGAKLAFGAMAHGATAAQACAIACRFDPYCAPPIITMRLKKK